MKRIKNRFSELLAEKARKENKGRISRRQVLEATGLAKTTIDSYARNEVTRYDETVLLALCNYFDCPLSGENGLLIIEEESKDGDDFHTDAA